MPIGYLGEYLELVSTMSYTVAARRLNLTQSALSKHILALEKEFDATFIDRSKQQIELTQQGRIFCEEASKMLDDYASAYRRLHNVAREVKVAGALRDSAIRNLQAMAADVLRDQAHQVNVVARDYPLSSIMDALREGKVDLVIDIMAPDGAEAAGTEAALAMPPAEHAAETHRAILQASTPDDYDALGARARFLTSVPLLAVFEQGHRLGGLETVSIAELAHERVMHPTGSMDVQQGAAVIEGIFARRGIAMRKHVFFASSWNDFSSIDLGGDVFIMPRSLFSKQMFGSQFASLAAVPVRDADARFPYGVWTRTGEHDEDVLRYVDALLAAAREVDGAGV